MGVEVFSFKLLTNQFLYQHSHALHGNVCERKRLDDLVCMGGYD